MVRVLRGKMKQKAYSVILVCVLISALFGAAAAGGDAGNTSAAKVVRYIYETESAKADAWVTFLDGEGFSSGKVYSQNADSVSFAGVDIIIIGNDAAAAWNTMSKTNGIKHAGKPVLGIGEGGSSYFYKAGQSINGEPDEYDGGTVMHALNPSETVFTSPNQITIAGDKNITVQTSSVSGKAAWIPFLPVNVTVLARNPTATNHALLCVEKGAGAPTYMFWGLDADTPSSLTNDGKKLFENAMWNCMGGYVPEFSSFVLVMAGLIGIFAAVLCVRRRN